jgi:TPR repeat protein
MNRFIFILLLIPAFALANGGAPQPKVTNSTQDCPSLYEAKEYARAREACVTTAEAGNSQARYLLGRMYEEGDGVTKDSATAVKWYRLAAESGHATSQRRLAGAYYKGLGVQKDDAQALRWLQRAANNGDSRAQKQLAVGYEFGIGGLPRDAKLAQQWRERAAKDQR